MEEAALADKSNPDVLELTAKIVSAHVGMNHVEVAALPELIQSVYRLLAMAGTAEPASAPPTPAVPIRRSVFPDHIVCLEDGKKLKMLKRYLRVRYGTTPEQYRQRWGLPADYPMVAPNYRSHRSSLAKQIGLGRKPANPEQTNLAETGKEPGLPAEPPVIRGRARRARVQGLTLDRLSIIASDATQAVDRLNGVRASRSLEFREQRALFAWQFCPITDICRLGQKSLMKEGVLS